MASSSREEGVAVIGLAPGVRGKEDAMRITRGRIGALKARRLRDVMLAERRFPLDVRACYPEDDEAMEMLKQAFQCPYDTIGIFEFDSSDSRHFRFFECLFSKERRTSAPKVIQEIFFIDCKLHENLISLLNGWILSGVFIGKITIREKNAFPVASSTGEERCVISFLADVFENVPDLMRPHALRVFPEHDNVDFSILEDWETLDCLEISTDNAKVVRSITALTNIRDLTLVRGDARLPPMAETGLPEYLKREDCKLRSLNINSPSGLDCVVSILEALKSNRSIKELEIMDCSGMSMPFGAVAGLRVLYDHIVDYLSQNPPLKRLILDNCYWEISYELERRLTEVFSTVNYNIEELCADRTDGGGYRYLSQLTFYNWAGRRLLRPDRPAPPPSLWSLVLGRIERTTLGEHITKENAKIVCADCMYFFLQRATASIFSATTKDQNKRERNRKRNKLRRRKRKEKEKGEPEIEEID